MGNWKTKYKVGDLADDQKLEMICKKCGRLTYINKAMICTERGREQLYLDEVERRALCKARGCKGRMRMAMYRMDEMSGFVGGLA
jgi:recombinational DNA repair protein RecR